MRTAEEEALKIPEFYTYGSFSSIVLFIAVRHDSATCHIESKGFRKFQQNADEIMRMLRAGQDSYRLFEIISRMRHT